jgi:hypothetical protein
MLLLDDDDELPLEPDQDEASLAARLGSDGLRAVDTVLIGQATRRWLKVARIVADALRARGLPISDDAVDLHVRRVMVLVGLGTLEARGNLRRPRWSEVRLLEDG